mgnify:CR=1 FL=1|tara:strand:- start:215 stop:670 length:456 start_codon:yes stop_codon:yes gene_type:complete
MNIQDLEQKYKELGAEIERLKKQPEGVWEPSIDGTFWMVDWTGGIRSLNPNDRSAVSHHNVYETEALARKASVLQRRSNLVIQACLNFDPDFEPDWSKQSQKKWSFYSTRGDGGGWKPIFCYSFLDGSVAQVSTQEIADKVAAYLNSQEIK